MPLISRFLQRPDFSIPKSSKYFPDFGIKVSGLKTREIRGVGSCIYSQCHYNIDKLLILHGNRAIIFFHPKIREIGGYDCTVQGIQ